MILDATAGNRVIWSTKKVDEIVYLDIEKNLELKPTVIADNTKAPFRDSIFSTIFYDPPYAWGNIHPFYMYPNRELQFLNNPERNRMPTYYGTDKYKTRSQLISHLYQALREFSRLLKPYGLLWVKWNEIAIPLRRLLPIFEESWSELLRLEIKAQSQTMSEVQTYWLSFIHKSQRFSQQLLLKA